MCSQLPLKTQDVKWHVGKFTAPLRFSLAPKGGRKHVDGAWRRARGGRCFSDKHLIYQQHRLRQEESLFKFSELF